MPKNDRPLGRGLEAMLGNFEIPGKGDTGHVVSGNSTIRIESIETNPYQPRTKFDEDALKELAESIKTYGLIQPVTVRPAENGRYQLISGERRFRAAQLAGLTEIPAFVRTVDDAVSIQMALVENIQRADLNAIEIALSYKMLIDECHFTQEELGEKIGKTNTTISNYLRLLKLSTPAQVAVRDNQITMGHARALVAVENETEQAKLVKQIIGQQLSVRQTETLVKKALENSGNKKTKVKITLSDEIRDAQAAISKKLSSKVSIKKDISGKGSINIPFTSDEELRRILALLQ
ncbi:MAG: ParB/RepB/Spo0J family partition protein [Bacteroidales bacterium]|nr:ParB/RepB/Spo0J family partition protein [Bacteroidales bacterium]MDY6348029.1 ParB/RepB/Spo0J family partition protein [Bacteroidales bacterium]